MVIQARGLGGRSSRPARTTLQVPGQPGLHCETLSNKKRRKDKRRKTLVYILADYFDLEKQQ